MSNLQNLIEICYEYPIEGVSSFFFFMYARFLANLCF